MVRDIANTEDIKLLVDYFYDKVLKDDLLFPIFTEVAQLNLEKHMPVMYNFWATMLLGLGDYKSNPMIKHIDLGRKTALKQEHFDRWLQLWEESIAALFSGPKAEEALQRAQNMAALMLYKIGESGKNTFIQ